MFLLLQAHFWRLQLQPDLATCPRVAYICTSTIIACFLLHNTSGCAPYLEAPCLAALPYLVFIGAITFNSTAGALVLNFKHSCKVSSSGFDETSAFNIASRRLLLRGPQQTSCVVPDALPFPQAHCTEASSFRYELLRSGLAYSIH